MTLFVRRAEPRTLYDVVCDASSALVIREYSSSFGLASRLLAEPVRGQVRNIYALVRVADEVVDNPDQAIDTEARERMLTWLEDDVRHALAVGYSANPVVHAFARTAGEVGVTMDLVEPFFTSMRADLTECRHTQESFERYVYGSAEVVGLMCLRAFVAAPDGPLDRGRAYDDLAPGAQRLGAAFQKLNFVRDLAEDHDLLHRSYFPDLVVEQFCDADRDRILDDIDADLVAAAQALPGLPGSSRRAVCAAHATFAELSARLRATPAPEIRRARVRVPAPVKLRIAAGAFYGGRS